MAKKKETWAYNCRELIAAPVMRKYLHVEWLTKLTSKDFKTWEFHTRETFRCDSDLTEAELHTKVWKEIEVMEERYQLTKEKLRLETKLKTHNKRFEQEYKNRMLYKLPTFDIVSSPSSRKAYADNGLGKYDIGGVLSKYDEVNMNGRIYPSPTATTKQDYFTGPIWGFRP